MIVVVAAQTHADVRYSSIFIENDWAKQIF